MELYPGMFDVTCGYCQVLFLHKEREHVMKAFETHYCQNPTNVKLDEMKVLLDKIAAAQGVASASLATP